MPLKDIILYILGSLATFGILAGGLGYLVQTFRAGGKKEKQEVIESVDYATQFWKDQANEYKEMMKVKDEKNATIINGLTEKVGILTGQLKSEKEQNERLEKIFQNRNPEMEAFMKYMVTSSEQHSETHVEMIQILKNLHKTSASNHDLLEKEQAKDLKIEATVTKSEPQPNTTS